MTETITQVPLLDFRRLDESEKDAYREAFNRVLESGAFILGPEVQAFEAECSAYLGIEHALGVSSGTDALLLAMMALSIGPGDEVICPTYSFFATAGAIARLGATPVFVDVHPCCYNLHPEAVAAAITPRTKAIMPVHLYGQCADMAAIQDLACEHNLPIIEDAAQGIGASCDRGKAAAMGLLGCISFYPTKNLSGFGDGGLVTTPDPDLRTRLDSLRVHGWGPKYFHKHVGGNFRMDGIQGALLRLRLPQLDELAARRRQNAAFYTEALTAADVAVVPPSVCHPGADAGAFDCGDRLGLPPLCAPVHTYNQFVVRVPASVGRDRVRDLLSTRKIGTEIYYPLCLHQQECFRELGYGPGSFPVGEAAAEVTLALPIFPSLTEAELSYVVDGLVAAMRG